MPEDKTLNPWDPSFYTSNQEHAIEHVGVKGMKWGVKRAKKEKGGEKTAAAKGGSPQSLSKKELKKVLKAEQKWQANSPANNFAVYAKVNNKAVKESRKIAAEINNKPEYAAANKDEKVAKKAKLEYATRVAAVMQKHADDMGVGSSPTGLMKTVFKAKDDGSITPVLKVNEKKRKAYEDALSKT